MPLLVLARLVTGLLGLVVFGAAIFLLSTWFVGESVQTAAGELARERHDWRLWTGLSLLTWSFLGRFVLLPLLAKPDGQTRFRLLRGQEFKTQGTKGWLGVNVAGPQDAETIILTHGWGLDSRIWTRTRSQLARRYRVVCWDLPGMGRSQGSLQSARLETFAEDLRRVIQFTDSSRVVLVGHSIGGMVIQTLAKHHPDFVRERVSGVVLVNTTHTDPLKTMWLSSLAQSLRWPVLEPVLWFAAFARPLSQSIAWLNYLNGHAHLANRIGFAGQVTRSELDKTTLLTTRNRQDIQARGNLAMFRWDGSDALKDIPAPKLVLAGERDLVTSADAGREIAKALANAELEVVDGANHMGIVEQAATYTNAIERFAHEAFTGRQPVATKAAADDEEAQPPAGKRAQRRKQGRDKAISRQAPGLAGSGEGRNDRELDSVGNA